MRTYKYLLDTGGGSSVEVEVAGTVTEELNDGVKYKLVTKGGRIITFKLFRDSANLPAKPYVAGLVDVDGKFSAKLSEFSWHWEYGVVTISYELIDGSERSVYDYLMEVGV